MNYMMITKKQDPLMKALVLEVPENAQITEYTIDNDAIAWPIDPNGMYYLYQSCSEHMRCCQIKAEGVAGNGFTSGEDALQKLMIDGKNATEHCVEIEMDLQTYGNAFEQIIKLRGGVTGLKRLPARTMYVKKDGGFRQIWNDIDGIERTEDFKADEVYHHRVPCVAGLSYAMPIWIGCHEMIELVYAAAKFNSDFFRNNAIPESLITHEGPPLQESAKADMKNFFTDNFQGFGNHHRAMFVPLGQGGKLDIKRVTAEIKDGDFLKLLDGCRDRIISAHGVPPRMLGIMTAGQLGGGSEVEGQLHVFEQLTLKPIRRRLADDFSRITGAEVGFAPIDITQPSIDADISGKEPQETEPPPLDEEAAEKAVLKYWLEGY